VAELLGGASVENGLAGAGTLGSHAAGTLKFAVSENLVMLSFS
jgi:hypothetical protein